MRITVTGDPGSGKSTFAKEVAARTGYRLINTGNVFRQMAEEMGVSLTELNEIAETQAQLDRRVDDYLKALSETREDMVLDSRMAWFFVKNTLKVRLTVDIDVAVQRIYKDQAALREKFTDLENAKEEIVRRRDSEVARYQTLYGVDISDPANFDLVINTSHKEPKDVTEAFEKAFDDYRAKNS
jgi:cytidylate kinase